MMYCADMKTKNVSASSKYIVYALHHPSSQHIYVGKSTIGMKRPKAHFFAKNLERDARTPKAKWIKALRRHGSVPEIVVLEECSPTDDLCAAEIFHIAYYRSIGMSLLNATNGGDSGCAEASRAYWAKPESREKARQLKLGTRHTAEARAKMSAARKARLAPTQEQRDRSSAIMKAKWATPEYRERARVWANTPEGCARTAEHLRRGAAKAHVTQRTPEYRSKMSVLFTVLFGTKERRQQRSEEMRQRWSSPEGRAKMLKANVFAKKKNDGPQ